MSRRTCEILVLHLRKYLWASGAMWTMVVFLLCLYSIGEIRGTTLELAKKEAISHFNKDSALRLWAASHGGVYVAVTDEAVPNPYLSEIPERDVTTPSGRKLTLMNPAYMLRTMMSHYSNLYGIRGHITSLNHFRRETAPDEWEKSALRAFERGEKEFSEISDIDGKPHFRLMKPLLTGTDCLKCHPGNKVGDIRGGTSISIPLGSYLTGQRDEVFRIAGSFTALWLIGAAGIVLFGARFRRKIEQRQEAEDKYVSVVENSLTGIYIAQAGKTVFANDRFAEIYGYSREEVIGKDSLQFVHPEEQDMAGRSRKEMNDGERPISEASEARELRKDGAPIWVQRRQRGISYCGRPAVLGSVLDLTSLKTAEAAKNAYVEKLEKKNQELEIFASIISHDLQEPLRKIRVFASRIGHMKGDSLCDKGRDYLVRMQLSAERMEELIMGLLEYSRVTSRAAPFTAVNLKDPVMDAVTDLSMITEDSGGRIEVGDLPEIEADHVQMRQLFQNLIGNALKYRSRERPLVRVFCQSQGNGSIDILVEDNGIGFEEKYIDRIFMPFQRLHGTRSAYPGTGMGLAICHKIVERHGGTITARSTPGQGSVFIVTLPKNEYRNLN